MSRELVHDARSSWWNGDITTLCGLVFKGGKGWKDKFFAVSINCPTCIQIRKQRK
ncbi:hypothetical protein IU422_25470 [Nocardia farcinica]|nr:hypothetical protein [Nocardia farcinica]